MNCNNNQNNNNGCGCNCNPHPTPAPEPVDINMSVCDRNINMLPMLQTYTTKVLKPNIDGCCKKNILKQCMMNCENYKYVIKWDFDLNGQTITVPENCILEFDGGSLKNGTIIGQDTYINDVGGLGVDALFGEGITRKGTWRMNGDEDKPYDPDAHSGLGKKTLKLGDDGSNILTQEDFDQENTIYIIQYDFTLGEDITVPANCVLEFDGGSISGAYTITGQNTGIYTNTGKIFDSSIVFYGVWSVKEVVANWFIASSDTSMFQKAFDFAKIISLNKFDEYAPERCIVTVTCLTDNYNIDDTLLISARASFDGNGSVFRPTANLHDKYMFSCNSTDQIDWIEQFPNNERVHIGNFAADGSSYEHGAHLIFSADSRRIHDIKVNFFKKIIIYCGKYLDNRVIERLWVNDSYTIDYTSWTTEKATASIFMGMGDNVSIKNCSFNSVAIENLTNAHIDCCMGFVCVLSCSNVVITNHHTESDLFLHAYGASNISVNGYYGYVRQDGKPVIWGHDDFDEFPEISLENCYFYKLSNLGNNYYSYKPVGGNALYIFKNVYGSLSNKDGFEADKGSGLSVALPHPYRDGMYMDGNFSISNDDDLNVEYIRNERLDRFSPNNPGSDFYVRISYLCPTTFMCFDQYTLGISGNEDSIRCYSNFNPMAYHKGFLFRMEFSEDGENFTHYFEFITVNFRCISAIRIIKTQDGYTVQNIPAKTINYFTDHYIMVDRVSLKMGIVTAVFNSEQTTLPYFTANFLRPNSKLITSEGVVLVRNSGSETFRPEGHLTGPTENRPTIFSASLIGLMYYDTTLRIPIFWNGTEWVDATGTPPV